MKTIVIVNKKANIALDNISSIEKFNKSKLKAKLYFTTSPKRVKRLIIKANKKKYKKIVIGGGDGTISYSINHINLNNTFIGILPLGTANDFAKTMHLPSDINSCLNIVAGTKYKEIDLGEIINDNKSIQFINVASIGVGSRVPFELQGSMKKIFKSLSYPLATIKAFFNTKPFKVKIKNLDTGEIIEHKNILHISIGNGVFYGGGIKISTEASINNHYFSVILVEVKNLLDAYNVIANIKKGELGKLGNVHEYKLNNFFIETNKKHYINVDGEIVSNTPAEFRVRKNAAKILID